MDIVELGMDVDSRPLKKTNDEMDRFVAKGRGVDGAARGVEKSTNLMAAGMKRAAVAITAVVGGMAAIGGGIRTLAQFEQQMSKVGAVSRATAAEMQAMRAVAADLGSTTEFTAQQAGSGLEFLARAGFSAAESVSAIPAVLDLATAAALDLGNAADISSNIMSAFGIEAGRAASVADVLAAASSRANTDVQQLGDAMSFVGPVAAALDIQMSDAAAAIGVLSDAGIQGSSAGTGLRRVISSLANPTKEAESTLADLGLKMEDLNPQTNDLTDIVQRLADGGLTAADALTIFGDRGGPAILALTSQTGRLNELTVALTGVEGEAKRAAGAVRDNLGGDIDSLFSSIQGLVIALGNAGLTAVIRPAIQVLTKLTRGVTALVNTIGAGIGVVSDFVGGLFGSASTQKILEDSIDNATKAIGEQITQVRLLSEQQRIADAISLESARVRLARTEREIEQMKEQREIARQNFLESVGFDELINKYNELMARAKEARDQVPANLAQGVQNQFQIAAVQAEEAARRVLVQINEIRKASEETNFLGVEDQARLSALVAEAKALGLGIEDVKDGMVLLNGEWVTGVSLVDRLGAGAGTLANEMNRAASEAIAFVSGLGQTNLSGLRAEVAALRRGATSREALEASIRGSEAFQRALTGPIDLAQAAIDGLNRELEEFDLRAEKSAIEAAKLGSGIGGAGKASKSAEKDVESLRKSIEKLEFDADPIAKYNAELAKLQELREFGLSDDAFRRGVQDLNDELANQIPMVNDVADAWAEFVTGGFRDFKGFVDSVLNSFKNMIAKMIATAARNQIVLRIAAVGSGGVVGTAVNAAGAIDGVGGLAGLAGSGGILGGVGSVVKGASGIFSGGGLGASFEKLGGLLSGSAGGLEAIGAALPALGVVAAGVGLIAGFFKKSKKLIQEGIRLEVEDSIISIRQFQDIQTKKFFGLSKSKKRKFSDVPEEFQVAWDRTLSGITGALGNAADQLGLAGENFLSVWEGYNLDIATKGLSDAEIQKKVDDVFRKLANDITNYGLQKEGVGHLIETIVLREGEELSDGFIRLGNTLTAANRALKAFNLQQFRIGLPGANNAASFSDMFGGVQAMQQAFDVFFQSMFSEQEQLEIRTERLSDAFDALGVAVPKTAREFRRVIEAQDLTTESGQRVAAAMIQLSGEFAALEDAAGGLNGGLVSASLSIDAIAVEDSLAQAQAAARRALQNVLRIMSDQIRVAEQAADSIRSIFDILTNALAARGLLDEQAQQMDRQRALAELRGGIDDPRRLRDVISTLNSPAEQFFGNAVDFARDFAITSNVMDKQRKISADQLTEAEQQVRLLEQQRDTLEDQYSELLGIGENTDSLEEAILDLEAQMRAVEDATSKVEFAIDRLSSALLQAISPIQGTAGAQGFGADAFNRFSQDRDNAIFTDAAADTFTDVADTINGIFRDKLGRNVDVAGLDFYGDLLQTGGANAARIGFDIATSREARTGITPGFGAIGAGVQTTDTLDALYGAMLGREPDPEGRQFWESTGLEGEALINAFRDGAIANGDTPAFAHGGFHAGGLRLVGERGPELEATGPSRIFSAQKTREIMRPDKTLGDDVRRLVEYTRELVKINNKQSRTLKEIEIQGETA